jgi:hypothetical protein
MREEIERFIADKRADLVRDEEWQRDCDPNDYESLSGIYGGWDMLRDLAMRFGIEWDES